MCWQSEHLAPFAYHFVYGKRGHHSYEDIERRLDGLVALVEELLVDDAEHGEYPHRPPQLVRPAALGVGLLQNHQKSIGIGSDQKIHEILIK